MTHQTFDPSLMRDIASGADAEERFERLVAHFIKLSEDVHTLKGNLAANTSLTKEMLEGQDTIKNLIGEIDVGKINFLVETFDNMKGGVRVLGWLERPAKWIAAIGAAAAVIYSIWNQK